MLSWNSKLVNIIHKYLSDELWPILLYDVADVVADYHFELALHVSDC